MPVIIGDDDEPVNIFTNDACTIAARYKQDNCPVHESRVQCITTIGNTLYRCHKIARRTAEQGVHKLLTFAQSMGGCGNVTAALQTGDVAGVVADYTLLCAEAWAGRQHGYRTPQWCPNSSHRSLTRSPLKNSSTQYDILPLRSISYFPN